jgi:hypothetical protein
MELEVLLSCKQENATGPYPEPDKSTQHPSTVFLRMTIFNLFTHSFYNNDDKTRLRVNVNYIADTE